MTDQIPLVPVPVKRAASSCDTRQQPAASDVRCMVTRGEASYPKSRSNYSISSTIANGASRSGKTSGKSGNNNNNNNSYSTDNSNGHDNNNNRCLRRSRSLSLTPLYAAAGLPNRRLRPRPPDCDPLLSFAAEQDDLDPAEETEEEEEEVSVKTALLPANKREKESSIDARSASSMDNGAEVPIRGRKQVSMRARKADSPTPPAQLLGEREAAQLQKKYEEKVNHTKYELVAGFVVERGIIQAYTVYRVRLPFELTERRRRIILRYYPQGCQEVMLYVNKLEFEHYMPVGYRPLPPRKTKSNSNSEEQQKKSRFKFFNIRR